MNDEDLALLEKVKQRAGHHSGGIYFDSPSGEKAEHLSDCYKLVLVCEKQIAANDAAIRAFREIQKVAEIGTKTGGYKECHDIATICREAIAPKKEK